MAMKVQWEASLPLQTVAGLAHNARAYCRAWRYCSQMGRLPVAARYIDIKLCKRGLVLPSRCLPKVKCHSVSTLKSALPELSVE